MRLGPRDFWPTVERFVAVWAAANDTALDPILLDSHAKITQERLAAHVKLVYDTFERLLVPADAPARKARRRG
jgi:hypothetical protein